MKKKSQKHKAAKDERMGNEPQKKELEQNWQLGLGGSFDVLFARLRAEKFLLGPAEQAEAMRLIMAHLPDFETINQEVIDKWLQRLKPLLAPLIAKSPKQKQRFYELYDSTVKEKLGPGRLDDIQVKPVVEPRQPPEKPTWRGFLVHLFHRKLTASLAGLLLLFGILGVGYFIWNRMKPPTLTETASEDLGGGDLAKPIYMDRKAIGAATSGKDPLTDKEIKALAERIMRAAGPDGRASLRELALRMSSGQWFDIATVKPLSKTALIDRPEKQSNDRLSPSEKKGNFTDWDYADSTLNFYTYARLLRTLIETIPQDPDKVDVINAPLLAKLTTALLPITQPNKKAKQEDIEKASRQVHEEMIVQRVDVIVNRGNPVAPFVTFQGHEKVILSIDISPDNDLVASVGRDAVLNIYDLESGKLKRQFTGLAEWPTSVRFSPDGFTLAIGFSDHTIKLYDATDGTVKHSLAGHSDAVEFVSFSSNGRKLLSASWDGLLKIWETSTGKLVQSLEGHQGWALCATFSPDGKYIASGGRDGTLKLWNSENGKLIHSFELMQKSWITSVVFSPNGKRIFASGKSGKIHFVNVNEKKLIREIDTHEKDITSLSISPDGNYMASGSYDKTAKIWDTQYGRLISTLTGHKNWITSLAWSPNGNFLATGSADRTIEIWNVSYLKSEEKKLVYPNPPEAIHAVWWVPVTAAALPLLLALIWLRGRLERLKAFLRSRRAKLPPLVHSLIIRASDELAEVRRASRIAAHKLGTRVSQPSNRLDPEASAIASAEQGGWFTPVFAQHRAEPSYLVIISWQSPEDLEARRLDALAREMADGGLQLTRYFIERDGNYLFENISGRGPRASLHQLTNRYPDHRLLYMGAGDVFLTPDYRQVRPWAEKFKSWSFRRHFTPVLESDHGRREVMLAGLFDAPPLTATSDGLLRFADGFEANRLHREENNLPDEREMAKKDYELGWSWAHRPRRWLSPAPVEKLEWQELWKELQAYLLEDQGALDWLRAAAVYPALNWDLLLYLGINMKDGAGQPLYSEERAWRLAALPWFRAGHMPDWLRTHLICGVRGVSKGLDRKRRREIIDLIRAFLRPAVLHEDESFDARALQIAREQVKARGRDSSTLPPSRANRPMSDMVFLDFLARENATDLVVEMEDNWLRRNWPVLANVLHRASHWRSLSVFALYALVALIVTPWPTDGALQTGAWAPVTILLGLGAISWGAVWWLSNQELEKNLK